MEQIEQEPGFQDKKMFGGIGFLFNGNMACGIIKEELIVRVGPLKYEATLKEPHTRIFDFTGRPMKGWVVVSQEGFESDKALRCWLQKGIDFARSLPPK
ncbi:MAG: TfoX/Sxy family protein [Nitrospinae bacterium]|nr:TfoX/Sxy family protein [Nitrospinota bacterium]